MAIRKTNAHFSLLNGAGNAGKKVLEVPRKSIAPVDHWAFLVISLDLCSCFCFLDKWAICTCSLIFFSLSLFLDGLWFL